MTKIASVFSLITFGFHHESKPGPSVTTCNSCYSADYNRIRFQSRGRPNIFSYTDYYDRLKAAATKIAKFISFSQSNKRLVDITLVGKLTEGCEQTL